jgi:hypothetical protein
VAASTSGGTDELIDFEVPEAGGIYTLVVHGWAVPTTTPVPPPTSSWVIPATTEARRSPAHFRPSSQPRER